MPQYDSIVTHDIDGAGLSAEGLLLTWTQTIKVFDFDPTGGDEVAAAQVDDASDFLREAYMQLLGGEIYRVGKQHPKYPNATCLRMTLSPLDSNSTTHITARLTWAEPGPFCSITYDVSTGQETRNYDADGNLCEVRYDSAGLYNGAPSTISDIPFIAGLRVPVNARSMRVTQFENLENEDAVPAVAAESSTVFWNKDRIWGFEPGELLYIGRRAVNAEGTRLYRAEYFFLINTIRGGWHHSFASYQDARGLVPRDVKPYVSRNGVIEGISPDAGTIIYPGSASYAEAHPLPDGVTRGNLNGSSAFRMLDPQEFAEYFKNIKQPVNYVSSPS